MVVHNIGRRQTALYEVVVTYQPFSGQQSRRPTITIEKIHGLHVPGKGRKAPPSWALLDYCQKACLLERKACIS